MSQKAVGLDAKIPLADVALEDWIKRSLGIREELQRMSQMEFVTAEVNSMIVLKNVNKSVC
jgi:hypothetical protein